MGIYDIIEYDNMGMYDIRNLLDKIMGISWEISFSNSGDLFKGVLIRVSGEVNHSKLCFITIV